MRGRLFVVAQVLLIAVVVLAPRWVAEWSLPRWLVAVGWVLALAGAVLALAAFPQLGRALTPLPEPRMDAELTTTGLYRWMRHPIYTGVLAMAWGWTLAHPSWATVTIAAILNALLLAKAGYEEELLRQRYPSYAGYAVGTPRFVPRLWRAAR